MTKLPVESWNIKPRLDLPPYELNRACPITGEVTGLDNHHIVRKSFTALGKEDNERLYWVELDDGEVIGNRIKLSGTAHHKVTTNQAAIVYANGVYYWEEDDERVPMRWQPPTMHRKKDASREEIAIVSYENGLQDMHDSLRHAWPGMNPAGLFETDGQGLDEETAEWLNARMGPYVEPGHDCPTCNRRVPLPKKASSPSTKVFSCRIPIDDAETFSEIVDAAAEHAGMKSKAHHVYNTLLVGMALILQAPKEDLPNG